jgi:hypothetical protein
MRAVALSGVTLSTGCPGARLAAPPDARLMEVRRLAVLDLRCAEDRIEVVPLSGFATCEQREPETIDEETGDRTGPMGRCLAWSRERVLWMAEGWAASGCGFVEEYFYACGGVARAEGLVDAQICCDHF